MHITKMYFTKILSAFLVTFTCLPFVLNAQDVIKQGISQKGYLELFGKVKRGLKDPMEGAHIILYEITPLNQLIQIEEATTLSNGKFKFKIDLNKDLKFVSEKKGFVTKSVEISTFLPEEQWDAIHSYKFEVEMYEEVIDSIQIALKIKPAGVVYWNDSIEYFDYDRLYSLAFKKEQEKLRNIALSHAELLRIMKEKEAQAESDRLKKEAETKVEEEKMKRQKEAEAEEERLRAIAEKQAKEEKEKIEMAAKLEADKMRKEAEELSAKGEKEKAHQLRKDADELQKKKNAEAQAASDLLKKKAEEDAEAFRLRKEAEAQAEGIRLQKEAESEAEAFRLQKEAEANAEAIRLMKEAEAKAEETRKNQAIKNDYMRKILQVSAEELQRKKKEMVESESKAEAERLRKEAEAKALTARMKNEEEARQATINLMKQTEEKVQQIKEKQYAKNENTKNVVTEMAEIQRKANEESLKNAQEKNDTPNLNENKSGNETSSNKIHYTDSPEKPTYVLAGNTVLHKPQIIEEILEGNIQTTKNTIVKYLTKNDTLQEVSYMWGPTFYYKNGKSIDENMYKNELLKLKQAN